MTHAPCYARKFTTAAIYFWLNKLSILRAHPDDMHKRINVCIRKWTNHAFNIKNAIYLY